MTSIVKYPIGIQDFEGLRNDGYLYVDKTAIIKDLIERGKYYFLCRPRRFGKSLLLSTIHAYFEGKRELFKGLAIDTDDVKWEAHPVMHLDLNAQKYDTKESLDVVLDAFLCNEEAKCAFHHLAPHGILHQGRIPHKRRSHRHANPDTRLLLRP